MAITEDRTIDEPRRSPAPAQVALLVLGLLAVLLLVWFFLLRGDGEEPDNVVADPAPVVEPTPEPEEEDDQNDGRNRPVETFEVFAPKDPFDPLISASTGGGGTTSGAGTTGDGTTVTPTEGTTTTTDGTGTTTTDGTGTTETNTSGSPDGGGDGGGTQNVDGHRVRVIDVYREGGSSRAQVQVDGTVYTVDEGERFADNFQLMSTSGRCATMLYGDDEFTLCEGEEILK